MLRNSTRLMSPSTRSQSNDACDKKQSRKSKTMELQEKSRLGVKYAANVDLPSAKTNMKIIKKSCNSNSLISVGMYMRRRHMVATIKIAREQGLRCG